MSKEIIIPSPEIAPFGVEITPATVESVWNTFIKPEQLDSAPPQSIETRALMGILRAVHMGLVTRAESRQPAPQHNMMQTAGADPVYYCSCGWHPNNAPGLHMLPETNAVGRGWVAVHIQEAKGRQA